MRWFKIVAVSISLVLAPALAPQAASGAEVVHPWEHIEPGGADKNKCDAMYFYGVNPVQGLTFEWRGKPITFGEYGGTRVAADARGEMTLTAKLSHGMVTPDSLTATFVQRAGGGCSPLPDAAVWSPRSFCANRDWKQNVTHFTSSNYAYSTEPIAWSLKRLGKTEILASGQLPLADRTGSVDDPYSITLKQPIALARGRYEYSFTSSRYPYATHLELDVVDCASVSPADCAHLILDNSALDVPLEFSYSRGGENSTTRDVRAGKRVEVKLSSRVDRKNFSWSAYWVSADAPTPSFPRAAYPRREERGGAYAADLGLCILDTAKPKISGKARVGRKLKAKPGDWGPGTVRFSYQWYRSGQPIKGATSKTRKLVKSDRKHAITVAVTGTKSSYAAASRVSKKTKTVK